MRYAAYPMVFLLFITVIIFAKAFLMIQYWLHTDLIRHCYKESMIVTSTNLTMHIKKRREEKNVIKLWVICVLSVMGFGKSSYWINRRTEKSSKNASSYSLRSFCLSTSQLVVNINDVCKYKREYNRIWMKAMWMAWNAKIQKLCSVELYVSVNK